MPKLLIRWATTRRLSCFEKLRADPLQLGLSNPLPRTLSGTPRGLPPTTGLDGKLPRVWAASYINSTSGTVREAEFCLGTSAPALESKGVPDPFFQSRRSFWSPACANQGSSHKKVIWSWGKLLIRLAANRTLTPYHNLEPKPSEKDKKCCT